MANVHKLPAHWFPASIAPPNTDLEVCVMDRRGSHALVFPVQRKRGLWLDAVSKDRVNIAPSHWRKW